MALALTHSKPVRVILAVALLVSAVMTALTPHAASAADVFPDCNWNCTANDVRIVRSYLGDATGAPLGPCTEGGNVTAYVWAEFNNNTASDRYAVWAIFDLWINHTLAASTVQCELDTIAPGTITAMIWGPVTWECGRTVTVQNLNLSWVGTPAT
jgi:hypothetical protein